MPQSSEASSSSTTPNLKTLREHIPAHCFRPSLLRSLQFVFRDLLLILLLFRAGLQIPNLPCHPVWRAVIWAAYGFTQGLVFTGIWILAHECGHNSFSVHRRLNATIGFVLHSIVLVPFFSWKFTHARHHRYHNHMSKDTVFVPSLKSEYRNSLWTGELLGHATDSPIVSIALLLAHQLIGWPLYIIGNAGAGPKSLITGQKSTSIRQSHLDPGADIFRPRERPLVLLSDLGLGIVVYGLWCLGQKFGFYNMCLLWGVPYLWMNHWLVAITYLHHTHPDVPHYSENSWTFQAGALSTIDRDFGFIGRHFFHGIIEYHVIHHMFPRIPFYHAEEATKTILPLLGKAYRAEQSSFLVDLWKTFVSCQFVEESGTKTGQMFWQSSSVLAH